MANTEHINNPDNQFQSIKLEDAILHSTRFFNALYSLQLNQIESPSILEKFLGKIQESSVAYQEVSI